jgi:hypothetical protein
MFENYRSVVLAKALWLEIIFASHKLMLISINWFFAKICTELFFSIFVYLVKVLILYGN